MHWMRIDVHPVYTGDGCDHARAADFRAPARWHAECSEPRLMQNEALVLLLAHVAWLGPLGIFGAWLWLGSDMMRRGRFLLIACGVLLVQAIAGVVAGYVDSHTTILGAALVFSSTSWLLVPALAQCFGERRFMSGVPLGLITPVAGAAAGLLCAVMTGAINPCG